MYVTPSELLRKISLGEDTSLELKAVAFAGDRVTAPSRNDLADEIAAIANTRDGMLLLGVDDKTRDVLGVPPEKLDILERFVYEICTSSIRPPVIFHAERMELPDSSGQLRAVLKIDVPRSLFVHESPGGYFHRQGSSKRKMPPDVLARLFQQRSQARVIRFDEQFVPDTTLADLDEVLWRRFVGDATDDHVAILKKMRILTEDEAGKDRASVAGVLLCSRSPERWLPGAFIQAVRYAGTEQDSDAQLDSLDVTGPLDSQVHDALHFVRKNMQVAARKDPARREMPQFSLRAIFEAIVNAVAHRDYSVYGSKVRLFLFDDRLELYSPGSLPNTVTVENIELRQATRNELVTSLLARCPVQELDQGVGRRYLMEKRGDGVPIIIRETLQLGAPRPVYRVIDDAEVLLTIYAAPLPSEATE